MKLDSKEELLTDFNKMISAIDFKNYSPSSPEFMSALFIGMMWQILSDIPDSVDDEDEGDVFGKDVHEELKGAEHYLECFMNTNDTQYKQMAMDELKHAKTLINMLSTHELSGEEAAILEEYEHKRSRLAERAM